MRARISRWLREWALLWAAQVAHLEAPGVIAVWILALLVGALVGQAFDLAAVPAGVLVPVVTGVEMQVALAVHGAAGCPCKRGAVRR